MRPVVPQGELPESVQAVMFRAPEDREDIEDIPGIVHLAEDGSAIAMEFMFEISKDELKVLRHEPYLTVLIEGGQLTPFSLQSTVPFDEKYETLIEHSHVCTENVTHEKQLWWRCDNPAHDSKANTIRMCDDCFNVITMQTEEDTEEEDSGEPTDEEE